MNVINSAIILAAGIGSRFNSNYPKCLHRLPNGNTILGNQILHLKRNGVKQIIVVVGFKKEMIMEAYPDIFFHYNPEFRSTNTSKSLMRAFKNILPGNYIWINGDVYLDDNVIRKIIMAKGNTVCVNNSICGDEEVKYCCNSDGFITEISKDVKNGEGEAVGVNKICYEDFERFVLALEECEQNDYFEKAIEISIDAGLLFTSVNVSDCSCIEVDFKSDMERVNELF